MMKTNELKQNKSIHELLEFGIIVIDKPQNCTSFDVSDSVRRKLEKLGIRKTSHFGTLDPMVTGVLPIALNRAVKLTGFFIGEDKEYIGTMRLHEDVPLEKIREEIKKKFVGKIIQMPPVRSSVKRQEREREVKKFELLEKKGKDVSFIVECQGGTYIRKLVHDLGEEMGIGAHMIELRRIRAGIFLEKQAVPLKELERMDEETLRKIIIPAEEAIVKVYPKVEVKKKTVEKLLHGAPLDDKSLIKKEKFEKDKIISVFSEDRFIGMYKVVNEKNIFAKPEFVLQPVK